MLQPKKNVRLSLVLVCASLIAVGFTSAAWSHGEPPAKAMASDEDLAGITRAALDYAEGWYAGDGEQVERSLHPDLAKRIVRVDPEGKWDQVRHMGALQLVQSTRRGHGKKTPPEKHQKDVEILSVFGNAASARLEMHGWIDYLHLGKVNGKWVIVNVLWERKPSE